MNSDYVEDASDDFAEQLSEIAAMPVFEQVAHYDALHTRLQNVLASIDGV